MRRRAVREGIGQDGKAYVLKPYVRIISIAGIEKSSITINVRKSNRCLGEMFTRIYVLQMFTLQMFRRRATDVYIFLTPLHKY